MRSVFRELSERGRSTTHRDVFRSTLVALKRLIPTAPTDFSRVGKEGVFTANGSAVWFERCRFAGEPGLIEGCSPECRGPRQLLTHQRALDRVLGEAVRSNHASPGAALLKNCRDPHGESYGAQENYEVEFADGWQLSLWRIGIRCLLPLSCLIFVLFFSLLLVVILLNTLLVTPVYYLLVRLRAGRTKAEWGRLLFGGMWFAHGETESPYPLWMEGAMVWLMRILAMPISVGVSLLTYLTRYRRTQRRLLPFLISRIVIAGTGSLDRRERFCLAEKAASRTRQFFLFLVDFDRPIFSVNNLIKPALTLAFFPRRSRGVFRPRQRLQIALGDSNLCEEAEYLKIATTALVIDAIESGAIREVPRMRRPLHALRKLNRDPTLTVRVRTSQGRLTAVEMQRFYWKQCKEYVDSVENPPEEVFTILNLWQDVIERLTEDPVSLFGRIDWLTKQQLLAQTDDSSTAASRKKIDLKYHELSAEGYFSKLSAAGLTAKITDEKQVERAMRMPPHTNPAAIRCHYIREFSQDLEWVSWDTLQLGPGFGSKMLFLEHEGVGPE